MSVRRPPRFGTKTALVFAQLQGSGPRVSSSTVAQQTGLSLHEVRQARARLFRHRHLPTPSREEWRAELRFTRGTVWPTICRYAQMGMTPAEIQLAVTLHNGTRLPYARVENALNKAWKQGLLTRRTPEERRLSRLDALRRSEADLRERITAWLEVAAQVAWGIRPPPARPHARAAWLELLSQERERLQGPEAPAPYQWQLLARLCAHTGLVLAMNDEQAVAQALAEEEGRLVELLDGRNGLVPDDELGRSYLLDLYLVRQHWAQSHDRHDLDTFPSFYDDVEPDIATRLAEPIARLRGRTPAASARMPRTAETAMVQYADIGTD